MKKQFTATITPRLCKQFAALSGDTNPLHTSDSFGKQLGFPSKIAFGMIAGALFSKLIGNFLPGRGAIYLSQELLFRKPMLIGTSVIVSGTIKQVAKSTNVARIETTITDRRTKQVLVSGEALVKLPHHARK